MSEFRFQKCDDCEHYRAEHGNDSGPCTCVVIVLGIEYTCNCKRFLPADGVRYWHCRRCGYDYDADGLDLENPPCPCGSKGVWVVAKRAAA